MRSGRSAHLAVILMAVGMLAACAPAHEEAAGNDVDNVTARNFADRMVGMPPPAPPSKPFAVKDDNGLLEFSYTYPAQAAAIPALVDKFAKAMTAAKADALKMAQDDSAGAKKSGFPFRAHSLGTDWSMSADTPRFLALQSETYVFTGGAHGMTGYDSLLWDKARARETSVKAVMTSPEAFGSAIRDRFCATLDRQRAEKRGAPVVRGDDDFTQCIDPMEQVLTLTSKDGKMIDGVTVIVGPYSAGPYAEGSYDVALPVDAAMRKAIKTEYQDAFAGG
ncbi:MAG: DUF4163 domain-containing protein [Sphingomonadaceae bacterium]|nr:DUF4163 domain-containing protein [Sphingomonadaceae bacterium]